MSRSGVGMVVDALLTDEDLRLRFAFDRIETIAELCLRGFDLSQDEIELFGRTDGWSVVPEERRKRRATAMTAVSAS